MLAVLQLLGDAWVLIVMFFFVFICHPTTVDDYSITRHGGRRPDEEAQCN